MQTLQQTVKSNQMQQSARKQSHDLARGGQAMVGFSAQIGNGANGARMAPHQLQSPNRSGPTFRDTLLSPKNVLAGARNSVARMNNTITEGMSLGGGGLEVIGGRK